MSVFPVLGHSEKFGTKWHEPSDKRYWERNLGCGQPAEPKTCLATEILSWQGIGLVNDWVCLHSLPNGPFFSAKATRLNFWRKFERSNRMIVELLTSTSTLSEMEHNAAIGALTCRGNADKEHVPSEVLTRIIKAGHESVLEHITLTFNVKGLSRACLQELARHRHISLSVESTRHTLKKNISDPNWVSVNLASITNPAYCAFALATKDMLFAIIKQCGDISDDELKYFLPEFWPTNLVLTSNVRELRHILKLRTAPAALKEFRELALAMCEAVPEEYRYLLKDCVQEETGHE